MNKLIDEFNKLEEELHHTMENYPLLKDDIEIYSNRINKIEEMMNDSEEYYLGSINDQIKEIINDIKVRSEKTEKLYNEYQKLARIWEELEINKDIGENELDKINNSIKEANELITSDKYSDIIRAIEILEEQIKKLK